ncbi:replication/maintenance protein RepL [Azospirillum griseum]|nr:replication/maintenance protein RepL [Azospirillum griseum]
MAYLMSDNLSVHALKRAFSPTVNPFVEPVTVEIDAKAKRRYVRTATSQELVDPETGEVKAVSMIHTVEERDDEAFVKVFADGVKAAFALGAAGAKVFQAVLEAYQREKMTGGYADCLTLFWFNDGLNGAAIGMSERTFNRGLKELLEKEFLIPKTPNVYWVNPALFFKGDRVAFVKEYRRRAAPQAIGVKP